MGEVLFIIIHCHIKKAVIFDGIYQEGCYNGCITIVTIRRGDLYRPHESRGLTNITIVRNVTQIERDCRYG